ncbi:MAG: O-antigen ligase family protein [Betaproteobacteria bacterium]|nr:O-antigen ligase family protein [Betaproteobacteria bacterium]
MTPLALSAWAAALFLASDLYPHTVALRLLLLFGGAALALAELARARLGGQPGATRFLPPLLVPLALWAAWAIASLGWSLEPARSLKELKNEVGYAYLAYWLGYVAAQARSAPRLMAAALGLGAAGACAIGLYALWGSSPSVLRYYNGPGAQSSALLTLMPCAALAAFVAARTSLARSVRWAGIALIALLLAAAYATLNRTVWLGFAAQLALLGAFWRARPELRPRPLRAARKWLLLATAACVVAAAGAMTLVVQKERLHENAAAAFEQDPRLELWPAVIRMIEAHPLTGYGFGRGIARHTLHEEFDDALLWHAHNLFLEAGVELGLPGIALLLLVLGATLREGWRLWRDPEPLAAACGVALLAVLAGMLVRNMTDVLWVRQNALLYWGVIGALVAWGRKASGAPRSAG